MNYANEKASSTGSRTLCGTADQLKEAGACAHKYLDELEQKLSPLLRLAPPTDALKTTGETSPDSPLVTDLLRTVNMVGSVASRIQSILSRLQV